MDRLDVLMRVLTRVDGLTGEAREKRWKGLDWPTDAETMVGMGRLQNVRKLAEEVISNAIPGDFMECGIWKGGVGILLAAIARDTERTVWLADSFDGCPVPDPKFAADVNDPHHTLTFLKVSLAEVSANLEKYGVHIGVEFLPGWFKDTLPGRVESLALLRIDADMYESTTQVLEALYDKVSPGGYVICDDFHNIPNCRQAILDFRERRGITDPINSVDWCAIYWQVTASERERRQPCTCNDAPIERQQQKKQTEELVA